MINRVILTGRLTKDPELRMTQTGTNVCSFTLAVDRQFKKDGQPDTDFISCVAWNKTAELMDQYLHKGSLIGLEGRIQTRSYDNNQGQKVYVTEVAVESVQFLEPRNASSGQNQQGYTNTYQNQEMAQNMQKKGYEQPSLTQQIEQESYNDTLVLDADDLPF